MHSKRVSAGTILLLVLSTAAQACNVPVFRYALERWRPDKYEIVLFHRGTLPKEDQSALAPVYKAEDEELLKVTLVNLDKQPLAENLQQLWDSQREAQAPWMTVLYPTQLRIETPVWAGRLTAEVATSLLDSPARQEVAKRLTSGQTAVWLMLDSADATANEAAANLTLAKLKDLEKSLELPELTASPDDEVRSSLPLTVSFSMLRIQRDNPREQLLIQMLLGSEPDLRERSDAMIFPVFGRGRALFPLIGAGITAENISDAATFLVGPCTCQLKEFNPGFDLLSTVDWDRIWGDDAAAALVAQAEDAALEQSGMQVPIPAGIPQDWTPRPVELALEDRTSWLWSLFSKRMLLIGGIVLAAILALVTLIASHRSQARPRQES